MLKEKKTRKKGIKYQIDRKTEWRDKKVTVSIKEMKRPRENVSNKCLGLNREEKRRNEKCGRKGCGKK
jgi:hypothetical protein